MEHFDIDDNELDQLFSDGLDGMEMTPPPEIWTGLEAGLGGLGGAGGAGGAAGGTAGGAAGSGGFFSGLKGAFWVKALIGGAAVVGTGTAVYVVTTDDADEPTPIADVETITPEQAASTSTFELNDETSTTPSSQENIADNTANYNDYSDATDNGSTEPADASPNTTPTAEQDNTIPADATADNTSSQPNEPVDSYNDPTPLNSTDNTANDPSELPTADADVPGAGDEARDPQGALDDPNETTTTGQSDVIPADVNTDDPNGLTTGPPNANEGTTIPADNTDNASDPASTSADPNQSSNTSDPKANASDGDANNPNNPKGSQDNLNDPQFVPDTGDTLDAISSNPNDGGTANPGTTDPADGDNTASNPNEVDPNVLNTGSGNQQNPEEERELTPREQRKEERKNKKNKATTQPGANDPTATNPIAPQGKPEGEIIKPWERFYLTASVSPEINIRTIDNVHADPDPFEDAAWLKANEESELTWTPNFRLGFDLNQKLAIQTGFSFYKWERSLDGVEIPYYVLDDEEEEDEEENGSFAYHTSSGYIDLNGQNYLINDAEEDDELLYSFTSNETLKYWYIPLEARYTFVDKKLKLFGTAGVSMHFLRSAEFDIMLTNEDNMQFTISDGIAGLKSNFFGYQFGFGAQYAITDRLNLYMEPQFRGTFTAANDDNVVEFKPYTFGLQTGLLFHF